MPVTEEVIVSVYQNNGIVSSLLAVIRCGLSGVGGAPKVSSKRRIS